ncbi:MAG: Transglutaminase-like superfamily protein [Firmicutes bacterium ADurb.Bin248]|nr:MAG: Transglutaminase-like superfamily protein [Firmicutes bacterium ADurb.Bin248]HOG01859.1 transglutaminase-like domain-containing protein [Clostridia bacterium]HPK14806.1 transglutaminase-like domain-containing protein [Clostridia bacterium]
MKKQFRHGALALALILALSALASPAAAAGEPLTSGSLSTAGRSAGIDASTASLGYIVLFHDDGSSAAMKAGLGFNGGSWSYYDYKMGMTLSLALTGGSGSYSAALFKKVGASYVTVAQKSFTALVGDSAVPAGAANAAAPQYAQYLRSVSEIAFSANDSIARKAAALCKDLKGDQAKILAIYNYIAKNFKYDYDFANKVISGQITAYTPNPESILSNKKGVCYDFASLFAAMCRSQGIPCKLVKGYSTKINGYHAWNSAYDSKTEKWYTVDLTLAVCKGNKTASRFSRCFMNERYYTPHESV